MINDEVINELLALEGRAESLAEFARKVRKKIQSAVLPSLTHPSGDDLPDETKALILKMTAQSFERKRLKNKR